MLQYMRPTGMRPIQSYFNQIGRNYEKVKRGIGRANSIVKGARHFAEILRVHPNLHDRAKQVIDSPHFKNIERGVEIGEKGVKAIDGFLNDINTPTNSLSSQGERVVHQPSPYWSQPD